jgi:putative methylase
MNIPVFERDYDLKEDLELRLRDLEIELQSLTQISEHDVTLEQYPTPAPIVASILYSAQLEHADIANKVVCDLGCGNGIFAIGAALLGARRVIGVDVQSKALKVCQMNLLTRLEIHDTINWVLGDVSSLNLRATVDTVVTNPPFGTKKRGADLKFLEKAVSIATVVYSIHLAGEKNRVFLRNAIERLGARITQIETFEFPIAKLYEFHKKTKHVIQTDLYRICTERK